MNTVKKMKQRLSDELIERSLLPADLAAMAGVKTETVKRYLSPYLSGGKIEMWEKFSTALGYDGLGWLIL